MSALSATRTPSAIGYSLDLAASIIAWPSTLVVTKNSLKPIWTTKYIFANHYVHHTPVSSRCYKVITDAHWAGVGRTIARVVWAVSIVLPMLDAVAWVLRQLARCDSVIASTYELADRRIEVYEREREFLALGDSVREFATFLLVIGCKEERDEGMNPDELQKKRADVFRHFCTHFSQNQPKGAFLESTKLILQLLESCYKVDYSKEDDLTTNIARAFKNIEERLLEDGSCAWAMGDQESALDASWQYLVAHHERFYHLCQSS